MEMEGIFVLQAARLAAYEALHEWVWERMKDEPNNAVKVLTERACMREMHAAAERVTW